MHCIIHKLFQKRLLYILLIFFLLINLAYSQNYLSSCQFPFCNYNDIPFCWMPSFNVRFGPAPGDKTIDSLNFNTLFSSDYVADKIHFLQNSAYAVNCPNGMVVSQLYVYYKDGDFSVRDIIMGFDTAEWAYDRPENQPCLLHNKVAPAYSWLTSLDSDFQYYGHQFYSSMEVKKKALDYLKLVIDPRAYNQIADTCGSSGENFQFSIGAITLENPRLPPVASFSYTPNRPVLNEPIIFDASSSSDSFGDIVSYQWNFGDGFSASEMITTHSYNASFDDSVTLVVTNSYGLSDTLKKSLKVCSIPILLVHGWTGDISSMFQLNRWLKNNGFDVEILTYDDAQSATVSAHTLSAMINSMLQTYQDTNLVNIIAHSFGGLVSRQYIEELGGDDKIDKLIMLATPNHGSMLADYMISPPLDEPNLTQSF